MPDSKIYQMISIIELSSILWILDPMNTCCCVNSGMCDEYDAEAIMIKNECENGKAIQQAILSVFEKMFWVGCMEKRNSPVSVDLIFAAIEEYLRTDKKEFSIEESNSEFTGRELNLFKEMNSRVSENRQFSLDYIKKYTPCFPSEYITK